MKDVCGGGGRGGGGLVPSCCSLIQPPGPSSRVLDQQTISACFFSASFSRLGRVAQSVGHLTRKSGVLGSIPGLATYFRFSFHFFKKGSYQLLAKVCARSTG